MILPDFLSPEMIWIVTGIVLILAEFVLPGLIVIFFGLGALITGLAIWGGMAANGPWPFVLFSVVSLGSLLFLRKYCKAWFTGRSMGTQITGEDEDFIGHMVEIASGFDAQNPTYGRVTYRGAQWDARSDTPLDAPPGTRATITARQGSLLIISKD